MKLQDLPIGTRFRYQDKTFVKSGPLSASSDDGGSVLIPRYAVLTPIDPIPAAPEHKAGRQVDEMRVLKAFDRFYARACRAADDAGRLDLAQARQIFLQAIKGAD